MNKITTTCALAIAGVVTIGAASPSSAAPVLSNTVAVEAAAPNAVTQVRYYRRGYRNNGGLIVGGLALGAIGAVAAQGYYRDRAYDGPYGYGRRRSVRVPLRPRVRLRLRAGIRLRRSSAQLVIRRKSTMQVMRGAVA